MSLQTVLEVCASILVSLGGGGAIVFALSDFLGKLWADRALAKQRQEYAELNIALEHNLTLVENRVQVELDRLGTLHKVRTESEFQRINEVWREVAQLETCMGFLPSPRIPYDSGEQRHRINPIKTQEFRAQLNVAFAVLRKEALSIPDDIYKQAIAVIKIAADEGHRTGDIDDPFVVDALPLETREVWLEERERNYKSFSREAEKLKALMHSYIRGIEKAGETNSSGAGTKPSSTP